MADDPIYVFKKDALTEMVRQILAETPTSLPANGGNADYATNAGNANAITGKPIDDIFHSKTINAVPDIDNTDGNWSTDFITGWSPISGTFPDGVYDRWLSVRQYQTSATKDFKIQFLQTIESLSRMWYRCKQHEGDWTAWREISTTPIKSTAFSGTTGQDGNVVLWAASERKIPIFTDIIDYYAYPFHSSYLGGVYMAHLLDSDGIAALKNVSGTVYYIEI